jgi:uncharacterized protein GlcG (DUF336 family)
MLSIPALGSSILQLPIFILTGSREWKGPTRMAILASSHKARSALYYRRPSKVFEDLVAQGGLGIRTLALRGASPLEGGIPLIADGKIIGAIGASGATSVQDGQVAKAGADVAK